MFRVAAGTGMTPEILSEYIGKHKQEVIKRYQKLHDAYVNDYEIFHLLKKLHISRTTGYPSILQNTSRTP